MKSVVATLIVILLHSPLGATRAMADTQSIIDKTYDAALLRPLSAFGMVIGGVMFIPAVMLGAANGPDGMEETWNVFVEHPFEQTFDRALGEF